MSSKEIALIGLVVGLFWLYLAADLATFSMGLDGVIYATIAKLGAAGEGSFWFPAYFDLDIEWFSDSPPLGVWLQSQYFSLFGDAFWVEKTFCWLMIMLIAALMVRLCRETAPTQPAWWALAIFFAMPVASHALKNNSLESMVTVAALLAVWAAWHGRDRLWLNVLVAVGCLVGMMIKGPVGLFPLAAPALFALVIDSNPRKAVFATVVSLGSLSLLIIAILSIDAAQLSIGHYLKTQLLASLAGDRHIDHGRVYQLGQLLNNLAVAGLFIGVAWLSNRKFHFSRPSWAFFGIGLAASLPLLISPRQYKHYLLPCLPFFAIWANMVVSPHLARWSAKTIWLATVFVLMLASGRTYWYFGTLGKDADQLNDVAAIAAVVASADVPADHVEFCASNYPRRAYLARHHNLLTASTPDNITTTVTSNFVVCAITQPNDQLDRVLDLNDELALWIRVP